ncbi:MAG: DUF3380 domain-containing protein [Caulobacteraceae bacterium]|nr:DUF3380 domain-containing protein [Caulobacteraceae bacterium]
MTDYASNGAPLNEEGFGEALTLLGTAREALWAVLSVETAGCGYLSDRRPKILFERHHFARLTSHRYDADYPDISSPYAGGYGAGGAHQYDRLAVAEGLDADAALRSASWGLGQILGENHAAAGFATARDMVDAFVAAEDNQLLGMAAFIAASPMKGALQRRDWRGFAGGYNGPDYAARRYDEHLAAQYARYLSQGSPDLTVRAAQVYLTYLGFPVGGIDGVAGAHTAAAITDFQRQRQLPQTGLADGATLAALAGR